MKAKVTLENGKTEILLTPENDFEIDLIEKINNKEDLFNINTSFNTSKELGFDTKHNITININEQ